MKKRMNTVVATALVTFGGFAFGVPEGDRPEAVETEEQAGKDKGTKAHGMKAEHALIEPAQLKWAAGPAALPTGAEVAVLEGDPAKEGPFTLRLKMPAGYEIAPHTHPAIEHVTVLSGTFHMGMGEQKNKERAQALPAGGFAVMPPKTPHFAWASSETVIQLHGVGPWGIDYVNPKDDPRQRVRGEEPKPPR